MNIIQSSLIPIRRDKQIAVVNPVISGGSSSGGGGTGITYGSGLYISIDASNNINVVVATVGTGAHPGVVDPSLMWSALSNYMTIGSKAADSFKLNGVDASSLSVASAVYAVTAGSAGSVTGGITGSQNGYNTYLTKYTDHAVLGPSRISDDGTTIVIPGWTSSQWTTTGSDIYRSSGKVGIGIAPTTIFQVLGVATIGQNTNGAAVIDAYGGYAYYGNNSATNGMKIASSGAGTFTSTITATDFILA
jgi:hypothetical protein